MAIQTRTSVVGILGALLVGVLVALAGSDGGSRVGPVAVFAVCGVVAYVINWVAFMPSNIARSERYFDLTGSVTYLSVIAVALTGSDDLDARTIIVASMVAVWALRLGTFLFLRVRREGHDARFDHIKVDPLRFLMTWTVQALW
ncbi:MAG: DUF1295 domain-containing protein, partial [Actinomycetota bacterium]|nr:DUF1295 domain-containing protein [Actinomycetota bacterium]